MMKEIIKKNIPVAFLKWYKKWSSYKRNAKFVNKDTREIFSEIYNTNHWKSKESISGSGSVINQTKSLITDFGKLLKDYQITSVLDIPCGDFNWMQNVDLSGINYIGADIVEDLIKNNISKYKNNHHISFCVIDLISDPLPKSDLIFVRDCFVHLSFADICKAINNIKASGCKYLLSTTFTDYRLNYDIITGDWRKINLQNTPFNFPDPIITINEKCSEGEGVNSDKSMALWKISNL